MVRYLEKQAFKKYTFIYFWLQWFSFAAVCGLLIEVASLVAEHRL